MLARPLVGNGLATCDLGRAFDYTASLSGCEAGRIFDAFLTTKPLGSGMSLTISKIHRRIAWQPHLG